MGRIKQALKQFRPADFLAPLILLLMIIPALIFRLINKLKGRKLWLICEQKNAARDNGYYFYKYVRKKHPEQFCFYVVDKKSKAYERVKPLGNIIQFGSLKHWLYYLAANLNISSQKNGNPNTILFYVLHVNLGLLRNRVFLQHGVIKDDLKFAYYDKTKFRYFVCGAKREHDYVLKNFGYNKESLILSGLPRWDSLKDESRNQKTILVMPTWRDWLGKENNSLNQIKDFTSTEFYKNWSALINDPRLIKEAEKNDVTILFYPHINMQKFLKYFHTSTKNVKTLSADYDIQEYLEKANLMVTDYSSAVFDFALLRKPVLYYQFDIKDYRDKQHPEGYFNYEKDGFGKIAKTKDALVDEITECIKHNFKNEDRYRKREDEFFMLNDRKNCERVYEVIK